MASTRSDKIKLLDDLLDKYPPAASKPKPKKGLGYASESYLESGAEDEPGDDFNYLADEPFSPSTLPMYQKAVDNAACFAVWFPLDRIYTDPSRFQNRDTAFSELSANQVAESFDINKFDPIVIWLDRKNNKHYVLSGHSRYEGFKRLKKENIPVRFFEGSEGEAIKFAKLDANRAATGESLIEDIKAYKLAVFGDEAKGIEPMSKKSIREVFRSKAGKLGKYIYLNPEGLFIKFLSNENRSEYPYIERFAEWVGQLRKDNELFTDSMEDQAFYFLYAGKGNIHVKKDVFFQLVQKRIDQRSGSLFPECGADGCKPLRDLEKVPPYDGVYSQIAMLSALSREIRERLKASDRAKKIWTEGERERVLEELDRIEQQIRQAEGNLKSLKRAEQTLFGFRNKFKR